MTVKNTIKACIFTYPLLFKTKFDVFEHLFLVCGNGYEWKDGQLVSLDKNILSKTEGLKHICENFQKDISIVNHIENDLAENIFIKAKVDMLIDKLKTIADFNIDEDNIEQYLNEHKNKKLYPASFSFCVLKDVSEDIADDWRQAIIEYIDFLNTHKELLQNETVKEWDKFLEVKNKLEQK